MGGHLAAMKKTGVRHTGESAAAYNEIAQTVFFPIYPVIADQILRKCGIDRGTCLDVGSGPGHLAIALATLSDLRVYALDNSRPMQEIAGKNIAKYGMEKRVVPVFGDVHTIPFDDASLDLVVSRGSFFFWRNLSQGFLECRRVLRPGGMAYIGGGFGNTRLRDEIVTTMRGRDPSWEEKRKGWYRNCSPDIVRSALAAVGIVDYRIVEDDSGYWIHFSR